MFHLLRAEWQKIGGNRSVMLFTIWLFPIMGFIISLLIPVILLGVSTELRSPVRWDEQLIGVWFIPGSELGRLIMLGFTSVVFAGEYQWGTWKSILTRTRRTPLVLTKFLTILLYMLYSFTLTALILLAGGILINAVGGFPYGPEVNGHSVGEALQSLAIRISLAVTTTAIGAGYAAVAAIFSRSIMGGLMVGFLAVIVENLLPIGLLLLGNLIRHPEIVGVYQLTPAYNIANVNAWLTTGLGQPFAMPAISFDPLSLGTSILILATWMIGLFALTTYLFNRQDITS